MSLDEQAHAVPGFIDRVIGGHAALEPEEVVVVGQDGVEHGGAGVQEAELLVCIVIAPTT
jgi:hypothetical protein